MTDAIVITIISQTPPPSNGSTIMTSKLLKAIEFIGYKTQLIRKDFSDASHDIGKKYLRKIFKLPRLLLSLFRKLSPSQITILFLTNRRPSFIVDCVLFAICKVRKQVMILYLHTSGFGLISKSIFLAPLLGYLLKNASSVVVLSNQMKKEILEIYPKSNCKVIRNCAPLDEIAEVKKRDPKRKSLTFVGNLIDGKGFREFLHIASQLSFLFDNLTVNLVGPESHTGQLDSLKKSFRFSDSTKLNFTGYLSSNEISMILSNTDIFIFPSRYNFEAQPLVIIEALQHGIPVLSSGVGSIKEMLTKDSGGRVFEKSDLKSFIEEAARIIRNEKILRQRRELAIKHFDSHFSFHRFVESWRVELNEVSSIVQQKSH